MSQKTFKFSVLALLLLGALFVLYISTPANAHPVLGVTNFDSIWLRDTGPTAQPVLKVDQLGAGKIVEFMDGGTPVFSINNGGGIVASTILTQGATLSGLAVSQPTAATTATPAALIDSLAAGSQLLSIRKNATPVFVINNNGSVTGQVLQNTLGQEIVCGSQAITAAATVVHTVSTPIAVTCAIAADPAGTQFCTYTNAAGVVTVKLWQSPAGTPVANSPSTTTSWCVVGTP